MPSRLPVSYAALLAGMAVLALGGCGADDPAPDPRGTTTASAAPSTDTGAGTTDPAYEGGQVPRSVPTSLAQAATVIETAAHGIAPPVRASRVRTTDGTTCHLLGAAQAAYCRVGTGIRTVGYCPPQSGADVVAIVVLHGRAAPRCGADTAGADDPATAATRLPDGQVSLAGRGLRCLGTEGGATCLSRDGRAGFFLSLDGYRVLR